MAYLAPANAPISGVPANAPTGDPFNSYVPQDSVLQYAPPPDTRGEISKGISRGVDNLQALGYGAAGLAADILGNKTFAQQMYEGAQRNMQEADQSPAAVAQFTDIASPGDAWDWFKGAAAEALPSSAASLIMSGGAALIFKSAATKLATDALTKKLVFDNVGLLMARGATQQEAKKAVVKQFFANELKAAAAKGALTGAYVGGAVAGSGMEGGSNWNEDVQKYGIQNTAPVSDLMYGIGGGLIESGLGPETQLVGSFAKQAAKKELEAAAKRGVLKNIGLGMAKASGSEGAEEFSQQILNQMSLGRSIATPQNWTDNFNAGMGGVAGGTLFGVAGGTRSAMQGSAYKAQGGIDPIVETPTKPTKIEQDAIDLGAKTSVMQDAAQQQAKAFEATEAELQKKRTFANISMIAVHNAPNMDPAEKQQQIAKHEQDFMEATAQLANVGNQRTEFEEGLKKELEKLNKDMLKAKASGVSEGITEQLYTGLDAKQSGQFAAIKGMADQHVNREIGKAQTRMAQHELAVKAIQVASSEELSQGFSPTTQDAATVKFHENAIKDELKFIEDAKKKYGRALEEARAAVRSNNSSGLIAPGMALSTISRDANHAINNIAGYYNKNVSDVMTKAERTSELRSRLDARRTQSKFQRAFNAAVSPAVIANMQHNQQYAQDLNNAQIAEDIRNGVLPGVIDNDVNKVPVINPRMDSTEFRQAMDAPIVRDPNARPVQDVVSDFNQETPSQLNLARQYNYGTYGNPNEVNVDPRVQLNQEEAVRKEHKRQQMLGAMAAWNAAGAQNAIRDAAISQENTETQKLWAKLDADKQAPAAAKSKEQLVFWLKGIIKQLHVLKDITKILHSSELHALPDYVQKAVSDKARGFIDLKTGTIYLISDRIHSASEAVRTLIHEGVGHFGIRAIMTPAQLEQFLRMVYGSMSDSSRWQDIKKKYPGYNSYELAEEYIADTAERLHVSKVDMPSARRAWTKVYFFLRDLLVKLGWINVTRKDIDNVILASVYHLVNMNAEGIKSDVAVHNASEWRAVRESKSYLDKFSYLQDAKEWVKRTSYSVDKAGKIIPSNSLTKSEQLMTGLHNAFDRGNMLVRTLHNDLRKSGNRVTMDENFAEVEKTTANRIAVQVGNFLRNIVGMDPSNWAHKPADGTLFADMSKLIGTNTAIPKNPKELLQIVGKVLQAMHAREANAELVRRQYKSKEMASILTNVEKFEAELDSGKLTTNEIAKIEKKLDSLYDQAETIASDVRNDLSGMSNAEAQKIMDQYITPSNLATWESISQKVQDINKKILDTAVANNILSPEVRKMWDGLYQNYVPLDAWEAHMKKVDPGFASMGRSFDMSMYELSKERKGNAGVESNPLVLLTRKYSQLIQAIEQAKVGTAALEMYKNHTAQLSEIFELDDAADAKRLASEIKHLLDKADTVVDGKSAKSMRESIKVFRDKAKELRGERSKDKLRVRAAKSADAKAKAEAKLAATETDLKSVEDAIVTLKQNMEDIKANPEYKSVMTEIADLRKQRLRMWNARGFKVIFDKDGSTRKVRKSSKFEGESSNVITVFDKDGTKVRMMVKDPYLLAAFKGTSTLHPGVVLQFLGKIQRVMAQLMTTYAPPFIAVNQIRDLTTGIIHMRNIAEDIKDLHWSGNQADAAFIRNVLGIGGQSALRASLEFERKGVISDPRMAKMFDLYTNNGGYTSMYGMASYEATQKNMERALKTTTTKSNTRDTLFAVANAMQDVSAAVENSTRLAAFTAIYEALVANGVAEDKAAARAAGAALDLTVNFTKKGTWSPILSSLFLFSQASINSTVRIAKAMFPESDKGKPVLQKRITKYAGGLAMFGMMAALAAKSMGGTDDDGVDFYDKLPAYRRNANLTIAVGRNNFIHIPVTFGYQAFMATGNMMSDYFTGRITAGAMTSGMFKACMENFSFIGGGNEDITMAITPTVFKPIAQLYSNKNYFGSKVYPEAGAWSKGEQPDSQKYWASTSELAKIAATWLNAFGGGSVDRPASVSALDISPASIEHVFKQYTGGLGQFIMGSVVVAEQVALGRTEKLGLDKLPIASRFMSHVDNAATMSEYSKVRTELETQVNEYKRAKAQGLNAGELALVLNETKAGRMLENKLNSVQNKLSVMKAELNKLELHNNVSSDEIYRKRVANEEKTAVLVKQLVKQARMVGVK